MNILPRYPELCIVVFPPWSLFVLFIFYNVAWNNLRQTYTWSSLIYYKETEEEGHSDGKMTLTVVPSPFKGVTIHLDGQLG